MDIISAALGLAAGAVVTRAGARRGEHRQEPAGLADLLGWGFIVADGVIMQKDGSLLAGFQYTGPDVTAATTAELNVLSRHVNDALVPFADDWMLHVDAIRQPSAPYAPSVFPDPITQLIDEERRSGYQKQASRQ